MGSFACGFPDESRPIASLLYTNTVGEKSPMPPSHNRHFEIVGHQRQRRPRARRNNIALTGKSIQACNRTPSTTAAMCVLAERVILGVSREARNAPVCITLWLQVGGVCTRRQREVTVWAAAGEM